MVAQQQTFNYEAESAKLKAIEQAEDGSFLFVQCAYEVLAEVARRKPEFSSLDVWSVYTGPSPKNPRAIGSVFIRAQREGIIAPTNQFVKSGRVSDHNQNLRIWESLVYSGTQ